MSGTSGYPGGISSGGPSYVNCPPNASQEPQYEVYPQSTYIQPQEQQSIHQQQQVVVGSFVNREMQGNQPSVQQQHFISHSTPERDFGPQQTHGVPPQFVPRMQQQQNAHRYRHPVQQQQQQQTIVRPTKAPQFVGATSPKSQRSLIVNHQGQRMVKVPENNIRFVVHRAKRPDAQAGGGIYLKPGGPPEFQGTPRPIRMQQRPNNIRMVIQETPAQSPRPVEMGRVHVLNNQGSVQQQQSWSNHQQTGHLYQSQEMNPQQQQQHQIFQSPPTHEIAYNVEHIFMENGNEVKKMPIKFGDKTIWVDCVPGVAPENREDQVVFDLNECDQPLLSPPPTPGIQPTSNNSNQVNAAMPQEANMKMTESQEDKDKIVNAVLHDLISPTELSARHGISVAKIREWVKATGNKLPSKYKVKYEKAKNNSLSNSPPSPMVNNQHAPLPNPISPQTVYNNSNRMPLNRDSPVSVRPQLRFQGPPLSRHPLPMQANQQNHRNPHAEPHKLVPQQRMNSVQMSEGQVLSPNVTTGMTPGRQIIITKPASPNTEAYKPKLFPGKLALCKNCGSTSPDFNRCIRCKKTISEPFKVIDDPNVQDKGVTIGIHRGSPGSTYSSIKVELSQKVGDQRGIRIQPKTSKRLTSEEPECIALSSDEEGNDEEDQETQEENESNTTEISEKNIKNELEDGGDPKSSAKDASSPGTETSSSAIYSNGVSSPCVVDDPIQGDYITLSVRSVRIGSYKSAPRDKVIFTQKGIRLVVPSVQDSSLAVRIDIPKEDLIQFLAHFGKGMPIFFLFISIAACKRVRDTLGMESNTGLWLDVASSDETHKRITILPDKMNEDAKQILLRNYGQELLKELGSKEANDILVRSSPKDNVVFRMSNPSLLQRGGPPQQRPPSIKYCTFPPSSHNSVTVSTEDYCVLEYESFLNDVIIDFYCRYLQYKIFSESDRERTHIFSTFFYNRLTSRPKKQKNKPHPVEDNPNLSAAEKRYERVKRWTKKVNLFDKDFIIIPINEHSHWFVAIICYPGLIGCRRMDNDEIVDPQVLIRNPHRKNASSKSQKRIVQIGSTTIIPLKAQGENQKPNLGTEEELSDRDEADASDDEMMDEEPSPRFKTFFMSTPWEGPKEQQQPVGPSVGSEGDKTSEAAAKDQTGGSKSAQDPHSKKELPAKEENEELSQEKSSPSPPSNSSKERFPIKQPCILIFDSLATGSRARVAATLRDYLMCEHKAKKGETRLFTKENMMGHSPKVPQQPNFSDCGIFLLQYVESFFHSPIEDYHLPITTLKNWFPTDIVRNKRSDIAQIIRELAEEQNPGKKLPFPNINFTTAVGSGYTDDEMEEEFEEEEDEYEEEEEMGEEEEEEATMEEGESEEGQSKSIEEKSQPLEESCVISKSENSVEPGRCLPSPIKIIPSLTGVSVSRQEEDPPTSASPDSTSTKDEEAGNPSASSLVDYSDSASDEMAPVPDSSVEASTQSVGGGASKRGLSEDTTCDDGNEGSKKTKLTS